MSGGSNPKQYGIPDGAKDLQDLIEYRGMNFALGNIFKAVYRLGVCEHSDKKRDLEKIIWFAQRELNALAAGGVEKVVVGECYSMSVCSHESRVQVSAVDDSYVIFKPMEGVCQGWSLRLPVADFFAGAKPC
jgi:hypothetical protein